MRDKQSIINGLHDFHISFVTTVEKKYFFSLSVFTLVIDKSENMMYTYHFGISEIGIVPSRISPRS